MIKKYLILGGTGPIGTGISNLLSQEDENKIYITTRQVIDSQKQNVIYITGDAHDSAFLFPLLESIEWDVIVDCMIYSYFEFESRINNLLSNTKQYIYMSSATVFAESAEPITEATSKLLEVCQDESFVYSDVYAITKARQEKLLQESKYRNWTIVRPYITYGDYRLQLGCTEKEYWLYGALHHRPIVFAKDVSKRYVTMTDSNDVGRSIVALLGNPHAMATDFNVVNNYALKWSEVLNIYLDAIEQYYGYRPKVYLTPTYETYQGGGRYEDYKYDRLYNRIFNNEKLAKVIDVTTFTTPKEGLTKCVRNFIEKPQFKSINFLSEISKAQLTGEWPPLNEIKGLRKKLFFELVKYRIIPMSL